MLEVATSLNQQKTVVVCNTERPARKTPQCFSRSSSVRDWGYMPLDPRPPSCILQWFNHKFKWQVSQARGHEVNELCVMHVRLKIILSTPIPLHMPLRSFRFLHCSVPSRADQRCGHYEWHPYSELKFCAKYKEWYLGGTIKLLDSSGDHTSQSQSIMKNQM